MAWDTGKQSRRPKEDFNNFLKDLDGYIEDEEEAKILLYKYLRENITFATSLISGDEGVPF